MIEEDDAEDLDKESSVGGFGEGKSVSHASNVNTP